MSQRWLRPVSLISLAAFLIANTPASASAIHCPWVFGSQPTAEHHNAHDLDACCCGHHDNPASPAHHYAGLPGKSEDESACPHCPGVPECPYGCCWCSVATVPMCSGPFDMTAALTPSLGARLLEASLLVPAAPCGELIRPPRA